MAMTKKYKGQRVLKTRTRSNSSDFLLILLKFDNGERQWCSVSTEEYKRNLTYYYNGEPADARIHDKPEVK